MARYCAGPTMAVDWGEDEAPVKVTRRLLGRVLGYFAPYRARGLLVAVCIAAESVLGLAPAIAFRSPIDYLGHPHGNLGHVVLLVAAGVGAALGGGLTGVADSYVTTVISEGIVFTLRRQVFENLLDQSVGWFTRSRSGELMSRLSNDIGAVNDVVTDTVFGLARSLFTAIATLVLTLRFSCSPWWCWC
jgi:ATP-binding cassette subfamily B protein